MLTITRVFWFEAAHRLDGYPGNCRNLHGHSYKVEVEVGPTRTRPSAPPLPSMVMDLADLKKVVQPVIDKLDHSFLNDILLEPTAENLCVFIKDSLLAVNLNVVRVRVWETHSSYAEWRR